MKKIQSRRCLSSRIPYYVVITSGNFQYSLNSDGLLMQSSPTPVWSLLLASSKRILAYQKQNKEVIDYSGKIDRPYHKYGIYLTKILGCIYGLCCSSILDVENIT